MGREKTQCEALFAQAGITINGDKPYDIQVNDDRFYGRLLAQRSLALGETYMEGWWDCPALDQMIFHLTRTFENESVTHLSEYIKTMVRWFLRNPQSLIQSKRVAEQHYNLSNDFFHAMLGDSMTYSCAYWKNADDLTQAQMAKYDLICQKLHLQRDERLLDVGCGWGGFAKYAAEQYGVTVTGITISSEQAKYAQTLCDGVAVNIIESDYRDIKRYNPDGQPFNKIVSVGMFEHVGYRNYKDYFKILSEQLSPTGLFLLHSIGKNKSENYSDPWIRKYVFPGGMLPGVGKLAAEIEKQFVLEDWHNFGHDYDKTLMAWHHNFKTHWPDFAEQFDESFYRMWEYYLLSCAGAFRARSIQLWQLVLSPQGYLSGYDSIR
jgi:cyclopropane-fatty-acyl-phospholipid synthase